MRSLSVAWVSVVVTSLFGACAKDVVSGREFECEADEDCPSGQACSISASGTGFCVNSTSGDVSGGDVNSGDDAGDSEGGDVIGPTGDADSGDDGSDGATGDVSTSDSEDTAIEPSDVIEGEDTSDPGDVEAPEDTDAPGQTCTVSADCDIELLGIAQLPCLRAKCEEGLCIATPAKAASCDDGNPCTLEDRCVAGDCVGDLVTCADAGPCTKASCDESTGNCALEPFTGPCDDGDPCTADETCGESGDCGGGTPICGCATDADCPDDGDPCNGVYTCDLTGETPTCRVADGTAIVCDTSADGPCSITSCNPDTGACEQLTSTGGCDDGDPCTTSDACSQGVCSGTPTDCNDGDVCTDDACGPGGCVKSPSSAPCNDGDACTSGDVCSGGTCQGTAILCDDGDACTTDGCGANGECVFTASPGASCSDGNACTTGDTCAAEGACVGTAIVCDDDEPCTADACNPADLPAGYDPAAPTSACRHDPTSGPCDDGNLCTTGDTCIAGSCESTPVSCPDGGPCDTYACVPGTGGCTLTPANEGLACDDGSACTSGDVCTAGTCAGPNLICSCSTNADCDDQNPCNGQEICATQPGGAKACAVGTPVTCPDSENICIEYQCNEATGQCAAQVVNDGVTCGDDDACVQDRRCAAGQCKGIDVTCTGTTCTTVQGCDSVTGCILTPVAQAVACDDGDACTNGDKCNTTTGQCAGTGADCDDGTSCTTDSCVPGVGCTFTPKTNGTACSTDKDACTVEWCQLGTCALKEVKSCTDGLACTTDTCNSFSGSCSHTADSTKCEDGNLCTADTCDLSKGCVYADNDDLIACSDDNSATSGDFCLSGDCLGGKRVTTIPPSPTSLICGVLSADVVDVGTAGWGTYVVVNTTRYATKWVALSKVCDATATVPYTEVLKLESTGTLSHLSYASFIDSTGAAGPVVAGQWSADNPSVQGAVVGLLEDNGTNLDFGGTPLHTALFAAYPAWQDAKLRAVATARTTSGSIPGTSTKQWVQLVGRDEVAGTYISVRCSRSGTLDTASWSCAKTTSTALQPTSKTFNFYAVTLVAEACPPKDLTCTAGSTIIGGSYMGSITSTNKYFQSVYTSSSSNTEYEELDTITTAGDDFRGTVAVDGTVAFHYGVDGFLYRCSSGTCTDVTGFTTNDFIDGTLYQGEPVFLQTVSATKANLVIRKVDAAGTSSSQFWTHELTLSSGDAVKAVIAGTSDLTVFGWNSSTKRYVTWRFSP